MSAASAIGPSAVPVVCRGKELFPNKFLEFMLSKPGDDEDKKKDALLQELKSVNDHLEKSGKPYFGGDDVCATDLSMAPKIKHIKIGADEVKVCRHLLPCMMWDVQSCMASSYSM